MIEIHIPAPSKNYERKPYLCPRCRRPNYISEEFYNEYPSDEYECIYCKSIYKKEMLIEGVEFDVDSPYEWVIKIEFLKSKSKYFHKAYNIAKLLPNYINCGDKISCGTKKVKEYCQYNRYFNELLNLTSKWKEIKVSFFDRPKTYNIDFQQFIKRVQSLAGDYNHLLNHYCDEEITYENLPMPYVFYPPLYGAFFAFSESPNSDIYFCECEKEAIENYFEILKVAPIKNHASQESRLFPKKLYRTGESKFEPQIKYKPNLCFRCNKVIPQLNFCHPMYGGKFEQKHGWYIQQEYLKNGLDPCRHELGIVLEDKCGAYLKKSAELEKSLSKLLKTNPEFDKISKELENLGSVYSLLNDKIRTDFGFRGIGEHWISETTLKHIIEALYPEKTVLAHYRPEWLEGLELDIYVPHIRLGLEYQGVQHFQAVKHWGGKEKLKIQQEHDARKKRLCDELGITLIYFDYTEDITTDYVKAKIKNFITK